MCSEQIHRIYQRYVYMDVYFKIFIWNIGLFSLATTFSPPIPMEFHFDFVVSGSFGIFFGGLFLICHLLSFV